MTHDPPPRLFLIDGYALIYRAFFAMLGRPLTTSRGENTSAAWGIANFLLRLTDKHRPEYVGWVHDAGTSFRHERYPDYKATREKLDEELQQDFDRSVARIEALLRAFRMPLLAVEGISPAGIDRVLDYANHPEFDEVDKLVVEYTIQVTNTPQRIRDNMFERLRRHFSEAQIVELTLRIALCGFFNRFNDALMIDAEPEALAHE